MDIHERWPHRWRNAKTDSFNSPIHGLGVIANADIAQGEVVIVYGGVVVPRSDIEEYRAICGHAGIQISDDFFMVPASRDELIVQGIVNHSCEPNIGFRSQVELVAMKDIKQGEEIFLDYAFMETHFDPFDCGCGNQFCRKVVTQDDWRNAAIQERFLPFYSPYLKAKVQ